MTDSWKEDCKCYGSFSESDLKRIEEAASCAISIHSVFLTIRDSHVCHWLQRTRSRWVQIGFERCRAPTNRCQPEDVHSFCEGAWVSKPTWRYRSYACSCRPILDASRIVFF